MTPRLLALLITENITRNNGLILEGADLVDVLTKEFPSLPQILQQQKVNISNLRMIARGDKGTAFTDGRVVVKITEDQNEAHASANIQGQTIPNVNKIHYVGKFMKAIPYQEETDEEPLETEYYIIIQDLLHTKLTAQEQNVANILGQFMLKYYMKLSWPFDLNKVLDIFYKYAYMKTHDNLKSPTADLMVKQILSALLRLKEKGITVLDIKDDNVGKNDNGYVLFDLGISKSPHIHIPTIS
jgi:serine/threonine protein kinase